MKAAAFLLGLACVAVASGAMAASLPVRKGVAPQRVVVKKAPPLKKAVPAPVRAKLPAPKTIQTAAAPAPATPDTSYDERELIKMPSPARLALRAEMRDRMAALDAVLQRLSEGKAEEAGQIAQLRLGVAVWWNHTQLSAAAQPEQYMPPAMQALALEGYKAATDFATVALTGDRHTASAMLPQLTGSCTQCHQAYRIR